MRRALLLAVVVALSVVAAAHAADPPFVTVGGGVGTFPIMAAKIADVINKEFPGVKASSIPGGSDLNLKNIQSGASTVGLSISMTTYQAYNGVAHFPQKLDKVRHVMSLYRGYVHYVASARSDIRSFEDITKRPYRVYVGKVGTLHHVLMNGMLKAYGITADDIRKAGGIPNPVAYSDVVRMLQDGQIDVAMLTGPVPYGLAMELAQSPGIRFLQASDEAVTKVAKALPGIGRAVIPKGSYKGQDTDIQTVAYMSHMVASSDLTEDFVYRLTAAMVKHMPDMKNLFAGAHEIRAETGLLDNPVPVHPGAKRYYDEKGIK
ncbi:MAG: TAXI family TRAP transporter solute-binding subunit [Candidatus Rokubacteria bacterium]|nr:TAXI family TRAP transporter solute-binding subunit [Candidatus Rokubacteria bacterium]